MLSLLQDPVRSVARLAREAVYIGVGAGVLAVQRLQVERREWERSRRSGPAPGDAPA